VYSSPYKEGVPHTGTRVNCHSEAGYIYYYQAYANRGSDGRLFKYAHLVRPRGWCLLRFLLRFLIATTVTLFATGCTAPKQHLPSLRERSAESKLSTSTEVTWVDVVGTAAYGRLGGDGLNIILCAPAVGGESWATITTYPLTGAIAMGTDGSSTRTADLKKRYPLPPEYRYLGSAESATRMRLVSTRFGFRVARYEPAGGMAQNTAFAPRMRFAQIAGRGSGVVTGTVFYTPRLNDADLVLQSEPETDSTGVAYNECIAFQIGKNVRIDGMPIDAERVWRRGLLARGAPVEVWFGRSDTGRLEITKLHSLR
jgi:hypothetical protein